VHMCRRRLTHLIVRELSERKALTARLTLLRWPMSSSRVTHSSPAIVFLLISHARACLRGSLRRIVRTLLSVSPRARSPLSSNFFAALSS